MTDPATSSTAPPSPAWQRDELDANPHEHADKQEKVRRMFASIAHAYDMNNRVHSFGRDQAWRRTTDAPTSNPPTASSTSPAARATSPSSTPKPALPA